MVGKFPHVSDGAATLYPSALSFLASGSAKAWMQVWISGLPFL